MEPPPGHVILEQIGQGDRSGSRNHLQVGIEAGGPFVDAKHIYAAGGCGEFEQYALGMIRSDKGGYMELMMEQIRLSQGEITIDTEKETSYSVHIPNHNNSLEGAANMSYTEMLLGGDSTIENTYLQEGMSGWGASSITETGGSSNTSNQATTMECNSDLENVEAVYHRNLLETMQIECLPFSVAGLADPIAPTPHDETGLEEADIETKRTDGDEELTEEQIEDFILSEQIAASEGNNASIDSKYTPQIGMEFETKEDAQHFLCFYGFLAGFKPVITHTYRTTSRKRNNEITKIEIKCDRHGKTVTGESESTEQDMSVPQGAQDTKEKRNTNVHIKTDCKVVMVIKEKQNRWVIARLDLDHNHELVPDDSTQLFSGHKYMTDMEKGVIRTLNHNNIPTRKMIAILSYLRGSMTALPYKKKDVSNYRTKINRELTGNDMTQVLRFFQDKQKEDPSFFYKFEIGEDKKVKHMFWADAASIKYYEQYGDCVSFDTTYMTNKYNLPFAPFVGITGHGHTCLFACAFISDETAETFKWIFTTFLEAMGGKHPQTIITDQDKAMRSAIQQVFPDTVHRNCFFHIKSKCYQKNGNCFAKNIGLPEMFEDIVNCSLTVSEFEMDWKKMIEGYHLENNKYFCKMWETRDRFIPVYFKNDFFPFLQSTGRSEGTNSRFKDNVGSTYSVMSFLREYTRIMDQVRVSEELEDNESKKKRPKELMFGYTIEKQAQEIYNRNIFRKFQLQLKGTSKLNYKRAHKDHVFEVYPKANQRWRKRETGITSTTEEVQTGTHPVLRHNLLSRKAATLTSSAAKTDRTMQFVSDEIDRIQEKVNQMLSIEEDAPKTVLSNEADGESVESGSSRQLTEVLENPAAIKQKGRPKKPTRLKPLVEEIRKKMTKAEEKKTRRQRMEHPELDQVVHKSQQQGGFLMMAGVQKTAQNNQIGQMPKSFHPPY
ncbi:hypothetical protein U9M48_011457 [Paspalum notatum var. saurae]|uniref:Protein FAR1-RELATED SEQUENCE n=1 Tax=Paspalum notatum var. saurae TaxID=547442 RepID=A0AAQ3SVS8_PASNO